MPHHENNTDLKVLSFNNKDDKTKDTKFDIIRNGSVYRLKIDACDHGFRVMYVMQVKKIDHTPAPLKQMVDPDEIGYMVVCEYHVHEPKWFLKMFGWTLERAAMYQIKKMRRYFIRALDLTERAEKLRQSLEFETDGYAGSC